MNVYQHVRRFSRWRRKFSSMCASISVSIWVKLVLKHMKCCKQFSESYLSQSKIFEWYSLFKSGRRSFEDDPHPGRLSTSHTKDTMACVREIICADRRLTVREVAEDVGIAFSMCQKTLTEELQLRRVSAKFVPRLLMAEPDDNVSICTDFWE